MTRIDVGTASFGDTTERAVIIAGSERGVEYTIGVVPVDPSSGTLMPVDDATFRAFAEGLIARAEETVPVGPARHRLSRENLPRRIGPGTPLPTSHDSSDRYRA